MMNIRRIFLAGTALAAVAIQGCGCSSSKKHYSDSQPEPNENSIVIEGAAAKGVLRNFDVSAYLLTHNGFSEQPIASGNTNDNGAYRLQVPERHLGSPIVIRVSPGSDSSMVCDLPRGCDGDTPFGQVMPVPSDYDLSLRAVLRDTLDLNTVNLTPLTELASATVENHIETEGPLGALDDVRALVAESNARVADRFGINGDINTVPVIDITNRDSVRAALENNQDDALRMATINSAIIAAMQQRNSNMSIGHSLVEFTRDYTRRGLAGNTTVEADVGWSDIAREGQNLLTVVRNLDPENPFDELAPLIQTLIVEEEMANAEEPDSYSSGTVPPNLNATDLEKVKTMVSDLSNLALSIGESALEGGSLSVISEEFADQVKAAEMANGEEVGFLLEALAKTTSVIEEAWRVYSRDNTRTAYSSDGVDVAISASDAGVQFTTDSTLNVTIDTRTVAVDVDLTARLSPAEIDDIELGSAVLNEEFALEGSATSENVSLLVKPNSKVTVDVTAEDAADLAEGVESVQTINALHFALVVSVAETDAENGVSLEGNLGFGVHSVIVTENDQAIRTVTVQKATLRFGGHVKNAEGDRFNFVLTSEGDARGLSFTDGQANGSGSNSELETEDNYAKVVAHLGFHANLAGVPNVVTMTYNVQRTGLNSYLNGLDIRYPGKAFRLQVSLKDGEPDGNLVVTNNQGVTLTLSQAVSGNSKTLEGNITVNGVEHATITGSPTVTIRYSDGSISSL